MATDLRKIWFEAIEERNMNQIYRLLYSTPNPEAGVERLAWTCAETTGFPADIMASAQQKLDAVNANGMNALCYSILLWMNDQKSPRLEVVRTLATVSHLFSCIVLMLF
jgi:hypothetical protein